MSTYLLFLTLKTLGISHKINVTNFFLINLDQLQQSVHHMCTWLSNRAVDLRLLYQSASQCTSHSLMHTHWPDHREQLNVLVKDNLTGEAGDRTNNLMINVLSC